MTFQARETMTYCGEERSIFALPLTNCDRSVPEFRGFSTGCRRGYMGSWELLDDALHLVHLRGWDPRENLNRLGEMFPGFPGSVEATWFSGEIVPDDVVDPNDAATIESHIENNWPTPFVNFSLVIHRGKLLSEVATDLRSGATTARITRYVAALFPPEEVGFLRAFNADLGDFTTKLVYADWLQERDDPRAALLRAEVERLQSEGQRSLPMVDGSYQIIPTGYVPPDDSLWFWRRLVHLADVIAEG